MILIFSLRMVFYKVTCISYMDISPVLKKTQLSKDSQLQETLLLFLQAQGIRYRPREGNFNTKDTHHLLPLLGDVVLTLVNKHRHLAKITDLTTGVENVIRLETMYNGNPQELDKHIRTLVLIYRKSECCEGVPIDPADLPLHQGHDTLGPEDAQGLAEDQ